MPIADQNQDSFLHGKSPPAVPAMEGARSEVDGSRFELATGWQDSDLAGLDRAIESIAARLAAGEFPLDSVLARMHQESDGRGFFLLALALGRVQDSEAHAALLERFSTETDSGRKGLLAVALAQEPTPGAFAEAHGELLDRVTFDLLEPRDRIDILERLVVTRPLPAPIARRFLEELEVARDPRLARSLALALSATLVEDEGVRSKLVAIALAGDAAGPAIEISRLIADAAAFEGPARQDLADDALSILRLSADEEARAAAALRLGRSEDPRVVNSVLALAADEEAAASVRVHAIAGLASTLPAASGPKGRRILELAMSARVSCVREAAVQALAALDGWSEVESLAIHESLLADPDPEIRREAVANVLDRIRIEPLRHRVELMESEDPHPAVRQLASHGWIG